MPAPGAWTRSTKARAISLHGEPEQVLDLQGGDHDRDAREEVAAEGGGGITLGQRLPQGGGRPRPGRAGGLVAAHPPTGGSSTAPRTRTGERGSSACSWTSPIRVGLGWLRTPRASRVWPPLSKTTRDSSRFLLDGHRFGGPRGAAPPLPGLLRAPGLVEGWGAVREGGTPARATSPSRPPCPTRLPENRPVSLPPGPCEATSRR